VLLLLEAKVERLESEPESAKTLHVGFSKPAEKAILQDH
jgi:hypothetical protein